MGVADRPRKPFNELCCEVIALKIGGADPLAERYNLLPIGDVSGNYYVRHLVSFVTYAGPIGMDKP
ncbi:MAG TPA: hypothetical protein VLW51_01775 [Solirubrobacteraceae bacterium]|nr:hypothetical protein [Solirubrobacteraceae bacterium]